jgi:hypothetical protein
MTDYQAVPASRHVIATAPIQQSFPPSLWARVAAWIRRHT